MDPSLHALSQLLGTLWALSTSWASFKRHSLPEYCFWPCPSVYDYSVPSSDATSSRIMHHVTKLRLVSWTWQWVHFTQMASTVTRSQSNRAPLGCGGTGDSHHGCAADKSTETVWCYHVNMDQNLWGMFPKPCWIYATKNYSSSEDKRGSNPVLARCT